MKIYIPLRTTRKNTVYLIHISEAADQNMPVFSILLTVALQDEGVLGIRSSECMKHRLIRAVLNDILVTLDNNRDLATCVQADG
jgi:hypothetical protein